MAIEYSRLAVIGVGHMGGSVALAARAAGIVGEVAGFDADPGALGRAHHLGVIDLEASSAAEAVRGASAVCLAVPVGAVAAVVAEIAPALAAGALVFDVGSVKATIVRSCEDLLPAGVRFAGCHPLAGTEHSGPESARSDLFGGRPCVICPSPRTTVGALEAATRFWSALGARVLEMEPELHDAVLAATSHLPHVAAYAVAGTLGSVGAQVKAQLASLSTTSLRDTTRIAESSPVMWRDIFLENREQLLPLIAALEASLGRLRASMEAGDGASIEAFLREARESRRAVVRDGR